MSVGVIFCHTGVQFVPLRGLIKLQALLLSYLVLENKTHLQLCTHGCKL